ncbi:MAG TPA: hypothetical protein DCR93_16645 [Cytophagales bacterium]|nr:hypothetical protein [Cytophagales bacterium]
MSTKHYEDLRAAIQKTNALLDADEKAKANKAQEAKTSLYYAHGATNKAKIETNKTRAESDSTNIMYTAAVRNKQNSDNLVTASTQAVSDAKETNDKISKAAKLFQESATMLTSLSGNVASLLALASTADNGSNLYTNTQKAFASTQAAAQAADGASMISLNTTIEAAQSMATQAEANNKTLNDDLKALEGTLQTQYSDAMAAQAEAATAVAAAMDNENSDAGVYQTAAREADAILAAEQYMNQVTNHGLFIADTGLKDAPDEVAGKLVFPAPKNNQGYAPLTLSQFSYQIPPMLKQPQMGRTINVSFDAFRNQASLDEYRLFFVEEQNASGFNWEAAYAIKSNFKTITIEGTPLPEYYSRTYITKEGLSGLNTQDGVMDDPIQFLAFVMYTAQEDSTGYPWLADVLKADLNNPKLQDVTLAEASKEFLVRAAQELGIDEAELTKIACDFWLKQNTQLIVDDQLDFTPMIDINGQAVQRGKTYQVFVLGIKGSGCAPDGDTGMLSFASEPLTLAQLLGTVTPTNTIILDSKSEDDPTFCDTSIRKQVIQVQPENCCNREDDSNIRIPEQYIYVPGMGMVPFSLLLVKNTNGNLMMNSFLAFDNDKLALEEEKTLTGKTKSVSEYRVMLMRNRDAEAYLANQYASEKNVILYKLEVEYRAAQERVENLMDALQRAQLASGGGVCSDVNELEEELAQAQSNLQVTQTQYTQAEQEALEANSSLTNHFTFDAAILSGDDAYVKAMKVDT